MSQIKFIYQKHEILLYSWFYNPKRVTRAGAPRLSAWVTQLRSPKIYSISGDRVTGDTVSGSTGLRNKPQTSRGDSDSNVVATEVTGPQNIYSSESRTDMVL